MLKWLKSFFGTRNTEEGRVANGAALLDRYYPGWFSVVKPEEINLMSPDKCVLGQLFGDYFEGQQQVFYGEFDHESELIRKTYMHGFLVDNLRKGEDLWATEIQNRI